MVLSGHLPFAESLLGWTQALATAPRGSPILVDVTELKVSRSSEEMRVLVDVVRAAGIACPKLAMVVADPVQWGLGRVFAGYSDSVPEMNLFGAKGEALAWLME